MQAPNAMNTIPSMTRTALFSLGLIVVSTAAQAKVYRCTVNGATTYTDRPCVGTESETVSMSAPRPGAPASDAAAKPVPKVRKTTSATATSGGTGWRLAGGYSDHVKDSAGHRTLTRTSYGIECDKNAKLRLTVYGLNARYSLTTPDHSAKNTLQGPYFDSLDAAASAACAAK